MTSPLSVGTDLLSCTEFLLHADKRTRALLQDPKVSLKAKCEILTSSLDKQCDEIKELEKVKNDAKKQVRILNYCDPLKNYLFHNSIKNRHIVSFSFHKPK